MGYFYTDEELAHHGILGQKWGVRRFESAGGHLTAAGKARYDGDKVSSKEKNAFSVKAAGHKALAKVYGANEKVYSKSNKKLSKLNSTAKEDQEKKAKEAQKEANERRDFKEKQRLTKMAPNMENGKFKSHKDYVNADKMALESYKKRKAEIKEEKKNSDKGFIAKNATAFTKNLSNKQQLEYDVNKNRVNAGAKEIARDAAVRAGKSAVKATAIVGAGIVGGMFAAEVRNRMESKSKLGTLPMAGMESHWEYKVGKKEVAKYITKAVTIGAITGAASGVMKTAAAKEEVRRVDKIGDSKNKRYNSELKKWQKGEV